MITAMALAFATPPLSDRVIREYMLCVRRAAVRLEPSEAAPEDVAKAAVAVCASEEGSAFNADVTQANHLRETALFYGSAQAVAARLCRRTGDCELLPIAPEGER